MTEYRSVVVWAMGEVGRLLARKHEKSGGRVIEKFCITTSSGEYTDV